LKQYFSLNISLAFHNTLKISQSGYYKHQNRTKPKKQKQDELLSQLIYEYHLTFDGILGYRRMAMFINEYNQMSFSERYIQRLMKVIGVSARIRRKKVNRKKVKPDYTADNILARNFETSRPNEKWLTDVTEFSIPGVKDKLYLSPIIDLYDNSIITFQLSHRNDNKLVFKMFDEARTLYPEAKPIFHSDRGFQYTSIAFQKKIKDGEFTQSMSRPGKCIDNGPMEGFFGTLKSEIFHGKKFQSMENLIQKIEEYI